MSTVLTELELDALTEMVNIGVNRAAASLREMIGEQVLLSVPKVTLVSRDKAIAALGYREVEMLRPNLDLMPLVKEAGLLAPACHIEAPIVTGDWTAWKPVADALPVPAASYGIDAVIAEAKNASSPK